MNIMDNLHKMRSFFKQKLNIAIIGAGRARKISSRIFIIN